MAFHVEISSSLNRARAFNLDEAEVQRLVERWVSDLMIELGDREWQPRKSSIKILLFRARRRLATALGGAR